MHTHIKIYGNLGTRLVYCVKLYIIILFTTTIEIQDREIVLTPEEAAKRQEWERLII